VVHVIPVVNKRFSACVSSSQARATLQSNVGRERKGSTFTRKQPTHTRAARTHTTAWLSVRIDVCVFMPFGPKVSYGCVHQRRRCGAHAALLLHPPSSITHTHSLAALGHGRSTGRQMRKARLQVGLFVMALLLTLVTQDKDPPAQTGPGSKGARLIPSGPYRARPCASSWERERSAHTRANQPASANNRPHTSELRIVHTITHTQPRRDQRSEDDAYLVNHRTRLIVAFPQTFLCITSSAAPQRHSHTHTVVTASLRHYQRAHRT
jgi:hypothetical protein